jgi:type 1 glutamine amidotransferase
LFCLLILAHSVPAFSADAAPSPRISVLIVDGMNNHDWPRNTWLLKTILLNSGLFTVDVSTTPPGDASPQDWAKWRPNFSKYDVVVDNFNSGYKPDSLRWPPEVEKSLEDYVTSGGGLVVYHGANNAFRDWPAFNDMIGLGWRDVNFGPSLIVSPDGKIVDVPAGQGNPPGHGRERDFQVTVLNGNHPITQGMPKVWLHAFDQLTHGQHGPAKNMTLLTYAYSTETKENEPMDWVIPFGKGRVYTTLLGHLWKSGKDTALRCVGFQTIFIRGVEWAATGRVTFTIPKDFPTADQASLSADFPAPASQPTP